MLHGFSAPKDAYMHHSNTSLTCLLLLTCSLLLHPIHCLFFNSSPAWAAAAQQQNTVKNNGQYFRPYHLSFCEIWYGALQSSWGTLQVPYLSSRCSHLAKQSTQLSLVTCIDEETALSTFSKSSQSLQLIWLLPFTGNMPCTLLALLTQRTAAPSGTHFPGNFHEWSSQRHNTQLPPVSHHTTKPLHHLGWQEKNHLTL